MKWIQKISSRGSSVTILLMAVLLISSMALREYAHFMDHAQPGSSQTNLEHDTKFHFVPETELTFEPPCWHQQVVGSIHIPDDSDISTDPHLLPETRAPPASV